MQTWEDINEGPNRKVKLTIDPGQGAPLQVYYGKDRQQITDQLASAQEHATRRISQLSREPNGRVPQTPKPPRRRPAPLGDGERFQLANDMQMPATVDKAVTRLVESATGVTMDELRDVVNNSREEETATAAIAAATQFIQAEPNWFASEHNKRTLTDYLETMGLDPTNVQSYHRAFQTLTRAKLLQVATEDDDNLPDDQEPERIAPTRIAAQLPRPRTTSTGIRNSDISGAPPKPSVRLKYTPEQIANFGPEKYKQLMMTDPEFRRAAEAYKPSPEEGRSRRGR
jgi:hypothetical protein